MEENRMTQNVLLFDEETAVGDLLDRDEFADERKAWFALDQFTDAEVQWRFDMETWKNEVVQLHSQIVKEKLEDLGFNVFHTYGPGSDDINLWERGNNIKFTDYDYTDLSLAAWEELEKSEIPYPPSAAAASEELE